MQKRQALICGALAKTTTTTTTTTIFGPLQHSMFDIDHVHRTVFSFELSRTAAQVTFGRSYLSLALLRCCGLGGNLFARGLPRGQKKRNFCAATVLCHQLKPVVSLPSGLGRKNVRGPGVALHHNVKPKRCVRLGSRKHPAEKPARLSAFSRCARWARRGRLLGAVVAPSLTFTCALPASLSGSERLALLGVALAYRAAVQENGPLGIVRQICFFYRHRWVL